MNDQLAAFWEANAPAVIRTLVIVVGLWIAYLAIARYGHRFIVRITARGGDDTSRGDTLWSMVRRLLLFVFGIVLALMVAATWDLDIGPLLAVGSVIGVALGFGAQDLVKDIINGFFILAEDQYRVGDVVTIAGMTGAVVDIRPRVTVLRDLDGNVHYVQNGEITVTSNLTQEFAQVVVEVGIAYKEPVDRALEVLADEMAAFSEDPEWKQMVIEPPQVLGVERLDDSAVVLRGLMKVSANDRWVIRREMLRRMKNRLDAEGIEIPFPHRTIYLGDGASADVLSGRTEPAAEPPPATPPAETGR